jgi:hypothetical protein
MEGDGIKLKSGLATSDKDQWADVAPRFGFAYDVFGSHKTVVRGGLGIFYADEEANPFYDQQIFNGQTSLQATATVTSSGVNLLAPFGSITPAQLLSGQDYVPQTPQLVDPNIVTPWAAQASIGVAQQIGSKWTIAVDYAKFRIHRQWIRFDWNQTYNPATGYEVATATGKTFTPVYANPLFAQEQYFSTPKGSGAMNDEMLVDIHRRFANNFTLAAAYTLARGKTNTSGAFYVPDNQFDIQDGWGPDSGDQRHTFNVNGLYRLKYGFELGGLFRAGSGAASSVSAGSQPFGDGGSDRLYLATTTVYNNPKEDYPSPTAAGYNLVHYNSFYGRPVYRVDSRLQKTFSIKERYKLVPIVEVFNMLNHPNYASYDTNITTGTGSTAYGNPVQSTSQSYCPRTIQFAGRFEF